MINIQIRKILAVITSNIHSQFDEVLFFPKAEIIMIKFCGHSFKVTVADMGESTD